MRESLKIIQQALNLLPKGKVSFYYNDKFSQFFHMEKVIAHFKDKALGKNVAAGSEAVYVEAPKGEFGVYIVADSSKQPYRCNIKSPGFLHLQGLNLITYNHYLADLVAIIGTLDVVFGEVDR